MAVADPPSRTARSEHDTEVLALWREWKRTGDPGLHERLVLTFAPMVKYLAFRTKSEIPGHHQVDDFISAGLEAVVRALQRFDPDKGARIDRFLWPRIHGAMVDEIRAEEWVPRSVRRAAREIREAEARLTQATGRAPSPAELGDALGISPEELARRRAAIDHINVESLDAYVDFTEAPVRRVDTVASLDRDGDPVHQSQRTDARERMQAAIAHLPERDRKLLVLATVHRLTFAQIGEVLGVSESRVSQLNAAAIRRLRALLEADRDLLVGLGG